MAQALFCWIYWNPPKEAFRLPIIDHPVTWYGILFVLGFICGYFLIQRLFYFFLEDTPLAKRQQESWRLTESLLWYIILSTIIGARLGHVLFYDPIYYLHNPLEVFKTWHGGLASHGAAVALPIALWLFTRKERSCHPTLTFTALFDLFCICVALGGFFIRIGNFVNQEIVGFPSQMPWAVFFLHPAEAVPLVPRHPVQLYEALAYLFLFTMLLFLWNKKREKVGTGFFCGIFLIALFGARVFFEAFKVSQGGIAEVSDFSTGQILSLPFIAWGVALLWQSYRRGVNKPQQTPLTNRK